MPKEVPSPGHVPSGQYIETVHPETGRVRRERIDREGFQEALQALGKILSREEGVLEVPPLYEEVKRAVGKARLLFSVGMERNPQEKILVMEEILRRYGLGELLAVRETMDVRSVAVQLMVEGLHNNHDDGVNELFRRMFKERDLYEDEAALCAAGYREKRPFSPYYTNQALMADAAVHGRMILPVRFRRERAAKLLKNLSRRAADISREDYLEQLGTIQGVYQIADFLPDEVDQEAVAKFRLRDQVFFAEEGRDVVSIEQAAVEESIYDTHEIAEHAYADCLIEGWVGLAVRIRAAFNLSGNRKAELRALAKSSSCLDFFEGGVSDNATVFKQLMDMLGEDGVDITQKEAETLVQETYLFATRQEFPLDVKRIEVLGILPTDQAWQAKVSFERRVGVLMECINLDGAKERFLGEDVSADLADKDNNESWRLAAERVFTEELEEDLWARAFFEVGPCSFPTIAKDVIKIELDAGYYATQALQKGLKMGWITLSQAVINIERMKAFDIEIDWDNLEEVAMSAHPVHKRIQDGLFNEVEIFLQAKGAIKVWPDGGYTLGAKGQELLLKYFAAGSGETYGSLAQGLTRILQRSVLFERDLDVASLKQLMKLGGHKVEAAVITDLAPLLQRPPEKFLKVKGERAAEQWRVRVQNLASALGVTLPE